MEPEIKILNEKKLIGKRLKMSFSENKTGELWQSFMPRRKEIINNIGYDLYSIQNYSLNYFSEFNPNTEFKKWACIEVSDFNEIPKDMESFFLKGGLYAVFNYKGKASEGAQTFQYIFSTWLPNSDFELDERPHFEILGEKYKNEDPNSEEEIWIPIKSK